MKLFIQYENFHLIWSFLPNLKMSFFLPPDKGQYPFDPRTNNASHQVKSCYQATRSCPGIDMYTLRARVSTHVKQKEGAKDTETVVGVTNQ